MKQKNLLLLLVPVAAVLLTLVGCSDYDNGFTETDFKFAKEFKSQFGAIDPEQDWNYATQGKVTVTTENSSEIKIYSEKAGTYTLLNTYKNVSGTKELVFDIVKGQEDIVVSDGEIALRSKVGGSVDFVAQASSAVASEEALDTRAHNVNGNLWYQDWVRPTNVTETERTKVIAAFSQPIKAYNTTPVPWDNYWVQQVYKGVAEYTAEDNHTFLGSEHMDHLLAYNGNTKQYEHINNFNDGNNTTDYTDDVTKEHYYGTTLMVNMGIDMAVMTSHQFGYLNSNDSENHFEYIILEVDGSYYVGFDFYCPLPQDQAANKNEAVSRDYIFNDWIVKISPAIPKTVNVAALEEAETQTWIIGAEDLGGGGSDIDYNDVVFQIKRLSSGRASIKALAAGGTLASYVYYGDKCLGEIHQMFGEGVKASGTYEPINAGNKTANSTEKEFSVPDNFTMGYEYSTSGNMGDFSVKVLKAGEMAYADLDETQSMTNVSAPIMGGAPYMICLPSPFIFLDDPEVGKKTSHIWAWPLEAKHISTVYPTFQDWVTDHSKSPNWYMYPASSGVATHVGVTELIQTIAMSKSESDARSTAAFKLNIPDYSATGIQESVLSCTPNVFFIPVNSEIDFSKYVSTPSDGLITYESTATSHLYNKSGKTTDPVMVADNNPKKIEVNIKQEMSTKYEEGKVTVTVFTMHQTSNLRFNTWGNDGVSGTELNENLSAGASKTFQVATSSGGKLTASITHNGSGSTVTTDPVNNTFTVTAGDKKDITETITVHQAADLENGANWPEEEIKINLMITDAEKTNPTITFNTGQVNLAVNETATVTVNSNSQGTFTIQPSFNGNLINASIQKGVITITGKAAGSTTITVRQAAAGNYNEATASFNVIVAEKAGEAELNWSVGNTNVTLSMANGSNTTYVGLSYNSDYTGTPTFTSSNSNVATATATQGGFNVQAHGGGEATITITMPKTAIYKESSKTIHVTVNRIEPTFNIYKTNNWEGTSSYSVDLQLPNGTHQINLADYNTLSSGITYSSNNTSVATVSNSGLITAKGAGTATITVTSPQTSVYNAKTATVTVTVKQAAQAVPYTSDTADDGDYRKKRYTIAGNEFSNFTTGIVIKVDFGNLGTNCMYTIDGTTTSLDWKYGSFDINLSAEQVAKIKENGFIFRTQDSVPELRFTIDSASSAKRRVIRK